jgi:MoxR-like ATPase
VKASDIDLVVRLHGGLRAEMAKAVKGQDAMVDALLIALLAGGHVLLEGLPGLGKSLAAMALGRALDASFKRIQFTPDLMPSDIIGTSVWDSAKAEFRVKRGPVFANVVLADEINRAPAKTQSALLEAMQERRVSIDGTDYPLGEAFIVLATQNPIELEGTYPLPEAQIDRFLMKIVVEYPSREEENDVLRSHRDGFDAQRLEDCGIRAVASPADLAAARAALLGLRVEDSVLDYMVRLARATREHRDVEIGVSPRGSVSLLKCARVAAALAGRDFAVPDDARSLVHPVFRHRVLLKPEAEMEGRDSDGILDEILETVEVPR